MRFTIIHELPTRLSILADEPLGDLDATLADVLRGVPGIDKIKVYPRIRRLALEYDGNRGARAAALTVLENLTAEQLRAAGSPGVRSRLPSELIRAGLLWLLGNVLTGAPKLFLSLYSAFPFLKKGLAALLEGRLDTPLLDATAIATALFFRDHRTAGLIGLLLTVGKHIEELTLYREAAKFSELLRKEDRRAWVIRNGTETQINRQDLSAGDLVVLRAGYVIPADGVIVEGEALIDQAMMTGEALPLVKKTDAAVYEGTGVIEGKALIRVSRTGEQTRLANMVRLVEDAKDRKADFQSYAEKLADRAVPYVFSLAGLTALVTGDPRRAASLLLVDYSCALQVAIPMILRTGIVTLARQGVLVKGGRFIERLARIDTVVFDKTGTLTEGRPKVVEVVPLDGYSRDFILRNAACVEEHFPHPIATALVQEAEQAGLDHGAETHGEVTFALSRGVVSSVDGRRFIVGGKKALLENAVSLQAHLATIERLEQRGYSLIFIGIDQTLAGIIAIDDVVREDTRKTIARLHRLGIDLVLLTGDSQANAQRVAGALGIRDYQGELFPEQKVDRIKALKRKGGCIAMIGDGLNDGPALACADVGVALALGADLAKATADVVLLNPNLELLPEAIEASRRIMAKVQRSFRAIVGTNTALLGLGSLGKLDLAQSAFLHNATTVLISLHALRMKGVAAPSRAGVVGA